MKETLIASFSSANDAVETMHELEACGAKAEEVGVVAGAPRKFPHGDSALLVVATGACAMSEDGVRDLMEQHGGRVVSPNEAAKALTDVARTLPDADDPYKAPEAVVPEPLLSAMLAGIERPEQPPEVHVEERVADHRA